MLRRRRRRRLYPSRRVLDYLLLLVLALPATLVGLVCALAVRQSGPGPILFRQERVGLNGSQFVPLKFRTMIDGPNPMFPDPARITGAGRFLRRTSLDKLPQADQRAARRDEHRGAETSAAVPGGAV